MGELNGASLGQVQVAARPARGAGHRLFLTFLLCTIAVTAIAVVVVATTMGQTTVALVVGLVSAAFFAGMMS